MYQDQITTAEQALSHLFFHCCLQDGEYTEKELEALSEKMVIGGLNKKLSLKEEVITYRAYFDETKDQDAYIGFLINLIKPINPLALYSYCVELCLTDALLNAKDEKLLQIIGDALSLSSEEQIIARSMMLQRKAVEIKKFF